MINKVEAIKLLKQDGYYLSYDRTFLKYHVVNYDASFCECVREDVGKKLSDIMYQVPSERLIFKRYKGFKDKEG